MVLCAYCPIFIQVGASIVEEHQKLGLVADRVKRTNHVDASGLLAVPRYSDLLDNIEDEDETERGRMLVTTAAGWRTEMARWIGEARAADRAEPDDPDPNEQAAAARTVKWTNTKLLVLFGGAAKPQERRPAMDWSEEELLMEELANQEEDERLDDGAIEVASDDEYQE